MGSPLFCYMWRKQAKYIDIMWYNIPTVTASWIYIHHGGDPKASPSGCTYRKPIIICGDLNVARSDIDLKNPKSNRGNAGFSDQEREKIEQLLEAGFTDAFRHLYPDRKDAYTWWSYRYNARKNNAGWRIDYFLTTNDIANQIKDVKFHSDIYGSDHCPVEMEIDI